MKRIRTAIVCMAMALGGIGAAGASAVLVGGASPAGASLVCSNVLPLTPGIVYGYEGGDTYCPGPHNGPDVLDASCVQAFVFGGWYTLNWMGGSQNACNQAQDSQDLWGLGQPICGIGAVSYRTLGIAVLNGNPAYLVSGGQYASC